MAELLCAHADLSSVGDYVHVLMRCGWPEAAHGAKPGHITDHIFEPSLALDDMPAELRETQAMRRR